MNELIDVEANLVREKGNHSKTSEKLFTIQQQMALNDENRKCLKVDAAIMTSANLGKYWDELVLSAETRAPKMKK